MSDYAYFDGENVSKLQVLLEEVTRAKPGSPKARFVQPDDDTVRVLSSKFHHVVYGRRGTGKSSLLRHIEGQLRGGDRIVAWVDQENLKALSYPDVLVAALAEIFLSSQTSWLSIILHLSALGTSSAARRRLSNSN